MGSLAPSMEPFKGCLGKSSVALCLRENTKNDTAVEVLDSEGTLLGSTGVEGDDIRGQVRFDGESMPTFQKIKSFARELTRIIANELRSGLGFAEISGPR